MGHMVQNILLMVQISRKMARGLWRISRSKKRGNEIRKLNWYLLGDILWLIWTIGRMLKIQLGLSHYPWDSCHILWLLSVWTSSIWGAANIETQSMLPHSTSWKCPWLASPPPLLLRVKLHATEAALPDLALGTSECRGSDLGWGVLGRLVLLQSMGTWSWSNIPEPSSQSALRVLISLQVLLINSFPAKSSRINLLFAV